MQHTNLTTIQVAFSEIDRSNPSSLISTQDVKKWFDERVSNIDITGEEQEIINFYLNFEQGILWEDDDLIVYNKPPGISSHFNSRKLPIGLLETAKYYYLTRRHVPIALLDINLAHRIDKETSGIIVLAKNQFSLSGIRKQFADKETSSIEKVYMAIVDGEYKPQKDHVIELPLISDGNGGLRVATIQRIHGRAAAKVNHGAIKPVHT